MDGSLYQSFIAVAELESFSLAAEKLYITQPAVSKRIALLEKQLNTKLFDRIGRKVILTDAGKAVLPIARNITRNMLESHRVIDNLNTTVSGQLSIVTSHHIGLRRLPNGLKRFIQAYPNVQLDIAFMDSEDACLEVEHGNYELAIVTLPLGKRENLKLTPLWNDPLSICVEKSHPLAKLQKQTKTIEHQQLAEYDAILPSIGTYTRSVIENALISKSIALNVVLETNYLETIRMMVSIGLGWSALPHTLIGGEITPLNINDLNMERTLGLVQHPERSISNAAKVFMETI